MAAGIWSTVLASRTANGSPIAVAAVLMLAFQGNTDALINLCGAARLREEQRHYVARLIQIWQHAVYGGQQPDAASLYTLCDGFAPALDPA